MKKKGFTLVELLVVIAIIAMLLAILMPALGKVRQLAQRIMCSTNIGGIGKAMLTYATDDKYESYPVAGPPDTRWDFGPGSGVIGGLSGTQEGICSWDWRKKASPGSTGNDAGTAPDITSTISACLFLLVKYADVSSDQFVCPGSDEKKFILSLYQTVPAESEYGKAIPDFWDFGSAKTTDNFDTPKRGRGHNSYSYQLPLLLKSGSETAAYPVTSTANPALAIIADRNPYWDASAVASSGVAALYQWDQSNCRVSPESIPAGNNMYHQKDGQNVLFADQHVKFEKSANCGIEQDNIYTTWKDTAANLDILVDCAANGKSQKKQCGGATTIPGQAAQTKADNYVQDAADNYLVSDYN